MFQGSRANVVYVRDVSERKRLEQILKESEELYRVIFNSTGTAMAIVEESGSFSLVNEEWEKLFAVLRR